MSDSLRWAKQKVIRSWEQSPEPKWSVKALEVFNWYFFVVFLYGFFWLVVLRPAFVTHAWDVSTFIGFMGSLACMYITNYIGFWIGRKENGYQLQMNMEAK